MPRSSVQQSLPVIKVTSPVKEKEHSCRGISFFADNALKILEVIGRGNT